MAKKPRSPVSSTLISEVMEISPSLAAMWLATNKNNRFPSKPHQRKLENDMKAGHWVVNGEAIKFDQDGNLLDGQHRLRAVVAADVTISSLVVMGVPAVAFVTMDTGRPRSLSDVLTLNGYRASPAKLASGVRMAMLLESGKIEFQGVIAHADAMAWFEQNKHISHFAYAPKMTRTLLPSAVYCGLRYKLWQNHPLLSDDFFEKFESGANLGATHPVKVLRDRLAVQKGKLGALRVEEIMALTIKAWNLFLNKKTIVTLRWTKNDDFPVIK